MKDQKQKENNLPITQEFIRKALAEQHKQDLGIFATKKDLESFATKKDLESFATKKDLESFATKKDLESFATKKDLESFATKKDLEEQNRRNLQVFATKEDLKETERSIKEDLKGDFHKLLTYSEKIYAKLEKKEMEQVAHDYLHKSAEDRFSDHERRIKALERPLA